MSRAGGDQLLLSSSRAGDTGYLEHAAAWIAEFAAERGLDCGLFVPYAAVTQSYSAYHGRVAKVFAKLGIELAALHKAADPAAAIEAAPLLVVGGGNTFALTARLQADSLMQPLAERARRGAYIGWSAGANIATPSLATSNDMPIVEPASFATLALVPFQINPHFMGGSAPGHNGESREQRLAEYCVANPDRRVIALPEGRALLRQGSNLALLGGAAWGFDASGQQALDEAADLSSWLDDSGSAAV
ncbi:dipeptidase PepE [Salinisphaera sp. SPP-AMP-43]|uniref:dipeptidase PepE n=1 Tax=Salinisphaera sp. SPP-AMP-43 TaxID=3121288 RepID=UPI003C6E89F3